MKAARFLLTMSICSALLISACSKPAADKVTREQQLMQDMSYGPHAQHKMDIYLPANRTEATPLILLLHGGGFVAGDKADVSEVAQHYLDLGYAVANINYRLIDATGLDQTPVVHQPSAIKIADQLADIQLAANKLSELTEGWKISTEKWAIAGHSAGATLSLLYAHGTVNTSRKIKTAANFAGATNFAYTDESEVNLLDPVVREVLYRATGKEPTNANKLHYMAISPYWVSNNTANGVPIINVRPSKDAGDALYQVYSKLLTAKGILNEYVVVEGAGHSFDPEGKWQEAVGSSDAFFKSRVW